MASFASTKRPTPLINFDEAPKQSKNYENIIWKRPMGIPIQNCDNTVLEFVLSDTDIPMVQVRRYSIITGSSGKTPKYMKDILDFYGYALLPTFVGVGMRMEEFARLYITSDRFNKPTSFVTTQQTKCGNVKRIIDYDFREGDKDFVGGLPAMLNVVKSNPNQNYPSKKTSITVTKVDFMDTVSAHRSILDGVVKLVNEQDKNKAREFLHLVACWIAMYYTEVAAESLSDSGDYKEAVFKLPIEKMLAEMLELRNKMSQDLHLIVKLFKPDLIFAINFSEIIDMVIHPYLMGFEDIEDKTFKPMVYYLLDYMKAYNKTVRTTRMPFDLNQKMLDGKWENRYAVTSQ